MFTGLIEKVGVLESLERTGSGARILVSHDAWDAPLSPGESISVIGVCLTVTTADSTQFCCDVLDETLSKSNLGLKRTGARLNLERAMRADTRLGGHFVTGHVDGVGTLSQTRRAGRDWVIRLAADGDLLSGIVQKGSVACDGCSLTVSALGESWFEANLIPFTWENTSFSTLGTAARVNIELDIIGKYVRRHMAAAVPASGVDGDLLRRTGFI